MKKLLGILLLGIAAAINSSAAPASAEQLRSEFEAALKAGDTNAIRNLFNPEGISGNVDFTQARMVGQFSNFLHQYQGNTMKASVELEALPDDLNEPENVINGYRYKANVSIIGIIRASLRTVESATNHSASASIPYGEKNGAYYLAGTITEKVYEPKVREHLYEVIVTQTNSSALAAFKVAFVYVQNEHEVTKSFDGKSAYWHKLVSGNQFKSCTVQKAGGENNVLRLEIRENLTNTLFASETPTDSGWITIRKKINL